MKKILSIGIIFLFLNGCKFSKICEQFDNYNYSFFEIRIIIFSMVIAYIFGWYYILYRRKK